MINTQSNVEVEILVNGNTVAKYRKDGRTYIEAKEGSEYEILIKNNGWSRILTVSSVDGLNSLTGESASEEDIGYVISGYNSFKIKGFRYNNDKVGSFKFSKKEKSYADGKSSDLGLNCGIIGVRVFDEKQNFTITTTGTTYIPNTQTPYFGNPPPEWNPYTPVGNPPGWDSSGTWGCNSVPNNNIITVHNMGGGSCGQSMMSMNLSDNSCKYSTGVSNSNLSVTKTSFDMGTTWGKSKESKVISTTFEKGLLAYSIDIYYASRKSLVEMGVIESNKPKVSFPKSFGGYAKPPSGWTE